VFSIKNRAEDTTMSPGLRFCVINTLEEKVHNSDERLCKRSHIQRN